MSKSTVAEAPCRLPCLGDLLFIFESAVEVKGGGTEDLGSSKLCMMTCSRRGYQWGLLSRKPNSENRIRLLLVHEANIILARAALKKCAYLIRRQKAALLTLGKQKVTSKSLFLNINFKSGVYLRLRVRFGRKQITINIMVTIFFNQKKQQKRIAHETSDETVTTK